MVISDSVGNRSRRGAVFLCEEEYCETMDLAVACLCCKCARSNGFFLDRTNAVALVFRLGMMIVASVFLCIEGKSYSVGGVAIGVVIGAVFLLLCNKLFEAAGADVHLGSLRGADARKAILILGVMTMHSFAEGVGLGVSFGGEKHLGPLISSTIAVHNIPEVTPLSLLRALALCLSLYLSLSLSVSVSR
jgi:zinc transporter ZupT